MGAAAVLLREKGFTVEGADGHFAPPMSGYLEDSGILCHKLSDFDHQRLSEFDVIVVGNSVPKNSDQAKILEKSNVALYSFPEVIGELVLKDRDVVGIAGTHGKTTTSFLLLQLLDRLSESKDRPGHFIGGILPDYPPAQVGAGKGLFVIESDEYDSAYFQKESKFHSYFLDHLILTSLEYDHADIYENLEQIKAQFERLFSRISGQFILNGDYQELREWAWNKVKGNSHSVLYGSKACPLKRTACDGLFELSFEWNGKNLNFSTNLIGEQNHLNLQACLLFLLQKGHLPTELQKLTKDLKLPMRRQQFRGHYLGALVYDDFAHHPKAIRLTLDGFREAWEDKYLIVVYEPISATARSSLFQAEYVDAFLAADSVILANPNLKTTAIGRSDLDFEKLEGDLKAKGKRVAMVEALKELTDTIDREIKHAESKETLLVVLSNRTCLGLWESLFINQLV